MRRVLYFYFARVPQVILKVLSFAFPIRIRDNTFEIGFNIRRIRTLYHGM